MKKLLLFAFLCGVYVVQGQSIRVNFMAGIANYYGELNPSANIFRQANGVVGMGATLDVTRHFLLRGEYNFARLGADDKKGPYKQRNLNFKTIIQEAVLMGEYNLFDLAEHRFSPYVFAGVGVFRFSPYTFDSANRKVYLAGLSTEGQGLPEYPDRAPYKKTQLNLPFGGGIKYAVSSDVHFGFELGLRYLFTDYLDDVSTSYVDRNILLRRRGQLAVDLAFRGDELKNSTATYPRAGSMRGSPKMKDLYYFGVARLGIRLNWFENSAFGGSRNRLGCPTRVL